MKVMHTTVSNGHSVFLLHVVLLGALLLSPISAWCAVSISDPDITDHVEVEFIFDPAVPFNSIDVSTDKGIVTLTGTVTNLLAKERSTQIAETVRGVRSVVNRIDVDPLVDRSGRSLRKAVNDALLYDAAADSYEISVSADDEGQVTLTGTVDSWHERELSETVAKGVSGVTGINNNIIIKAKSERPDTEIKPEIEKRLQWDTLVDNALINVRVEDGKVYLSGVVGSAAEKRRAEWDAHVAGVEAVDSAELKVERWARDKNLRKNKYVERSDLEIRKAVQDALLYDPRVYAFNLDVTATGGIVTLRGVVDNIQAKKAAIRDARNTVGVIGINSLIKVRPVARIDDDKIAENVRNALLRNPFTESYEIKVQVKNQVARLNGTVDSYFEKAEAENVAFRAKGVTDVKNSLTVSYPAIVIYNPYIYSWTIYDYPWYKSAAIISNKSDWVIKQAIESEFLWSPFVDSDDITVSVEDGIATLTGSVDSIRENEAAEQNAFEGGAKAVVNKLRIMLINDRLFFGMTQ
jgi:osmotically-inducible protein OsmY